ncbi:OmpA family protein [Chachezhania sediminis]|uniref:OmpA family protein n=1 Tax=Chachezhania sediminis TaxID=2599291 RepID=UPI00131B9D62|nr:OmpA family protein [Chachezhania sediminis]
MIPTRRALCLSVLLAVAVPAGAATVFAPALPAGARQLVDQQQDLGSYALPTGPFADGTVPVETVEGEVRRQSWQMVGDRSTPSQILAPLKAQLAEAGFETVFECAAQTCGGFDFRFGTDVLPAPGMHVDLRDYRFLAARRPDGTVASVLVSRSRSAAYVQIVTARAAPMTGTPATAPEAGSETVSRAATGDPATIVASRPIGAVGRALIDRGMAALDDLQFSTGHSALEDHPYASLADLADFLKARPGAEVALVGHTDTSGSLIANQTVSRKRAEAVRQRLIDTYDIPAGQLTAEGVGYLAPRASNLAPGGPETNRRVEAVLITLGDG